MAESDASGMHEPGFGQALTRLMERVHLVEANPTQLLAMVVPEVERRFGPHRQILCALEGDPPGLTVSAFHEASLPVREHLVSSGRSELLDHLRQGRSLVFPGEPTVAEVTLRFALQKDELLLLMPLFGASELVGAWAVCLDRSAFSRAPGEEFLAMLARFLGPLMSWSGLRTSIGRRYGHLPQTERLAELGRLVAGVAHELSSPLQSIISMAELLQRDAGRADPQVASHRILRSALRCSGIVQDLLGFAHKDAEGLVRVKVQETVLDALDRDRLGDVGEIQLRLESEGEIADVRAEPQRLAQVFLNLITNARQAVEDSGRAGLVVLELSEISPDDSRLDVPPHVPVVRVAVIDKGPGVSIEARDHIFEPFFTTKEIGVGSGLGLSISRSLITGMGGVLYLDESCASGARFVVELPGLGSVNEDGPTTLEDLDEESIAVPDPCRILLVDDDRDVLDTYEVLLALDDHLIRGCDRARKALQALEDDPFDIILCDIRLPDMSGPELLEAIKKTHPDLASRVIFATGDVINDATRAFLASVPNPTLLKPFRLEDFYAAVQTVMPKVRE